MLADRVEIFNRFDVPQWIVPSISGGGVLALQRATSTRVTNTIAAGLLATPLVGEPIMANRIVGLIAVFAGIWIATTEGGK